MSLSHTRRRDRIYRCYVTREAIAEAMTPARSRVVPAADVEGAVLNHVQKLLAALFLAHRCRRAGLRFGERVRHGAGRR